MNNKDKIAAQELIISIAQAEIKKLMKKKGKRFVPEIGQEFWHVEEGCLSYCPKWSGHGGDQNLWDNFNCYETEELANKAAVMMKRSNAIIMACLTVDPDFVPDYSVSNKKAVALLKKWGIE